MLKQNLNFQLKGVFQKQDYQVTGKKFHTPLPDQQAPQTRHICPSCQSFKTQTVANHQDKKTVP